MKRILLLVCLYCCVTITISAQSPEQIKAKTEKKVKELTAAGWKIHKGAEPMFNQLYEAYSYEAFNETDNPLQSLYVGHGSSEQSCLTTMLLDFARTDIADWYDELLSHFRPSIGTESKLEAGCLLDYTDFRCRVFSRGINDEDFVTKIVVDTIDATFLYKHTFCKIFANFYRIVNHQREEMIYAIFTEDFLKNRRIPIPVYEGYKTEYKHKYDASSFKEYDVEVNLNCNKMTIKETQQLSTEEETKYESKEVSKTSIKEEKLAIIIETYSSLSE